MKSIAQYKTESIERASLGVIGIARALGQVNEEDIPAINNPVVRGHLLYGLEELDYLISSQAEDMNGTLQKMDRILQDNQA